MCHMLLLSTMEPEKITKFYSILRAYRGRISKRTCENEVYRENKVYSLWVELGEKLDMICQTLANIFCVFFCPERTLNVSLDRLISKVAFCPPRDTYVFNFDFTNSDDKRSQGTGELLMAQFATSIRKNMIKSYKSKIQDVMKYVECFYTTNKYGNRIACILIHGPSQPMEGSPKVIVYSHTNAEDIGTSFMYLWRMRKSVEMPIFTYDYSGYGMSSGCPSERNLYADVEAAIQELCRRTSFKPQDMILFGESIGSVPTVYIASRSFEGGSVVHGAILQSAFMSGLRIYFDYDGATLQCDPFPNIERLPLIKSKTLIIHGTEDQLVDISHAVKMHHALKNPATPFWANGHSHMNIHKHKDYFDRLKYFFRVELADAVSKQ